MQLPENFGKCFDVTAKIFIRDFPETAKLCHGLGIANLPAQRGEQIAHAWIEYDEQAYDCVWMVHLDRSKYRQDLKAFYIVEYSHAEVLRYWLETSMSGPWDETIAKYTKEGKEGQ